LTAAFSVLRTPNLSSPGPFQQHAVEIDIVEDRGSKLIGTAKRILPFVKDDDDPADDFSGLDWRECW